MRLLRFSPDLTSRTPSPTVISTRCNRSATSEVRSSAGRRMVTLPSSVVAELEGTLLRDACTFPYFMLVAFEASGLPRFAALLALWPALRLLELLLGRGGLALRCAAFVATAGVPGAELEAVARAVLPKFMADDVDTAAWAAFGACEGRRVVVTRMPRVMVEWFAREHLGAHDVVGCDLEYSRLRRCTGFVKGGDDEAIVDGVRSLFPDGDRPDLGLGRSEMARTFLPFCKEQLQPPSSVDDDVASQPKCAPFRPVIFHDGRLVRRPTALMSLAILLWIPLGVLLAVVRITLGIVLPIQALPYVAPFVGGAVITRGRPPAPTTSASGSPTGVLFVCTHRTLMDPVALSFVLGRRVAAVTYSLSRLSEILSPIPTVRLTRDRDTDAARMRAELARGDVAVCPEGTTCREPFLLRFSALFAELSDRIVPVATNYRVGLFHPTTARGWKAMDPIFFFMNPRPVYEVTFLNELPAEATCAAGRSPVDVANYVQRILAATLGFECTTFTRKDKYRVLAGNDGIVNAKPGPTAATATATKPGWQRRVKEVLGFLRFTKID